MKKIIFVLLYCLCVVCNSNAQKIPSIVRSRFEVSTRNISFSGDGGSKTITVKADQPWSVKEYPASWASLTRYEERIEVKVNGNNFNESRNTSFSITSSGKTITIGIKQDEMPILEINPNNANFTATGGTQIFTIKSNISWEIGENTNSWIHLAKSGNTLTLKADLNPQSINREGEFTILSRDKSIRIYVTQSGISPNFDISSTSANFTASGGSKTFTVTATAPWNIETGTTTWGHLTINGNELTLKVDANNQISNRDDYFTIKSGAKSIRVNITQLGLTPKFGISSTSANFTAAGGSQTFTINSNSSWSIETQPKSWGHLIKNGKTLTLNVDKNNQTSSRDDYFTIRSGSKRIRVDITQAGASPKLDISATSAYFDENGGTKKFNISSNQTWHIDVNTTSWGRLYKDGNTLTLKVEKNMQTESRRDFFVIKSEDKKIRVDITQAAGSPYLLVNGRASDTDVNLKQYGGTETISVNTNVENYEILNKPSWCYITEKTPSGFVLGYIKNSSSYPRSGSMRVIADGKIVQVNLNQVANYRKWQRRRNGGWLNMAIGFEAGYGSAWYANSIVGLRLGNYKDVLQFEMGITPGIAGINYGDEYEDDYAFHLPVYSSLKLSTKRGKFYLKLGGTYNVIYDKYYEGKYSLRAGFGSAWKHFEWDWASFQLNAPTNYWYGSKFSDILNEPDMMFGMRMAWYITR